MITEILAMSSFAGVMILGLWVVRRESRFVKRYYKDL